MSKLSSAAKKAWATRRKKNPKKWRKRKPPKFTGTPLTEEEKKAKPGETIYYSTWEKEMVKKYGPKWFLKKRKN